MSHPGTVDQAAPGSEQAFVTVRRRSMRERVTIGQVWRTRRRRDGDRVVRIRQVHRADRRVEVIDGAGARFQVTFSELRRLWRQTDDVAL